jgi:TonB family protein
LQPLPNSRLRDIPRERNKGIIGTIVVQSVVLVLLIVLGFSVPPPPETEEGILVNFGVDETGTGLIEPSQPAVQEEASPPPAPQNAVQADEQPLITQNTEEAPAVKKVDPEAERKRLEKIEAERIRRAQLEEERKKKEAEEAERKRIEAEQQRQADIASRTRNALANSKNAGTTTTSEGVTGGQGNQGVPTGDVSSQNRGEGSGLGDKGISYDLGGRGVTNLQKPNYIYQEEGKVVVKISVDRTGKVTMATPGEQGSTTLDKDLYRIAREAALKTTFEPNQNAPLTQTGTITYIFKLK